MHANELTALRADQVGSLLRPAPLKAAFTDYLLGLITASELRQVQDEAIREVIFAQEAHGLPVVTDGEFRRFHFMESFGEVAGMEPWKAQLTETIQTLDAAESSAGEPPRRGTDPTLHTRRPVSGRLRLIRNRPLEELTFTLGIAVSPVKVTLLSTDRICQGYDAEASRHIYASNEEFLADVIAVQRQIVQGLVDGGCRYIQIDGPSYTRYVDAASLEVMRARGEDPLQSLERAIAADNAVIAGFPEVTFGMHLCRGNRRSLWHREGAYDAIAERLFQGLRHQRLLLEYDTPRAGTFEPLRFVPRGKVAVLGLITTKVGRVETLDELQRRIDEAARFLPLEQIALSPQCGFSSDLYGNQITEDQQWRKLDVLVETARRVWGRAGEPGRFAGFNGTPR
ncbi:MAG TPA: methionine synthase [Terriglobia bacterium]|nr:methionine synthase [Terriglobia bacterium]